MAITKQNIYANIEKKNLIDWYNLNSSWIIFAILAYKMSKCE